MSFKEGYIPNRFVSLRVAVIMPAGCGVEVFDPRRRYSVWGGRDLLLLRGGNGKRSLRGQSSFRTDLVDVKRRQMRMQWLR